MSVSAPRTRSGKLEQSTISSGRPTVEPPKPGHRRVSVRSLLCMHEQQCNLTLRSSNVYPNQQLQEHESKHVFRHSFLRHRSRTKLVAIGDFHAEAHCTESTSAVPLSTQHAHSSRQTDLHIRKSIEYGEACDQGICVDVRSRQALTCEYRKADAAGKPR